MAAFAIETSMNFIRVNCSRLQPFRQRQPILVNHVRNNQMFRHEANKKEHDTKYSYEVSKDPKEWEFVEKLMPMETVPAPIPKSNYPSGWRPPTDASLSYPYFIERTKNHMLPVYLQNNKRGLEKYTIVKKIQGDLWLLHKELKAHIEKEVGTRVGSLVHEGNCLIKFKGDYVYYAEQWILSKGF